MDKELVKEILTIVLITLLVIAAFIVGMTWPKPNVSELPDPATYLID